MAKSFRTHNASIQVASVIGAGTNKIKRKIRDIERLLAKKRDTLPDTVIVENERILDALQIELKKADLKTLAQKYSKKYHMVRFFEKKKALKYYNKELKNKPIDKVQIVERAIDLCYTVNFPKTEKYISLYVKENDEGESTETEATVEKRKFYRDLITKHYKNKSLPLGINEILMGKTLSNEDLGIIVADLSVPKKQQTTAQTSNTEETGAQQITQEGESDDDFFE